MEWKETEEALRKTERKISTKKSRRLKKKGKQSNVKNRLPKAI